MPNVALYNMQGENIGEQKLSDEVFGQKINKTVMHMAVVNFLANQRQGTQSTLTRSEVKGGGAKPWRQKGTGRARQGSTRSPQWTHGGIALGPKPRDYSYSLTKKTKRVALKSALSSKVEEKQLLVVDKIEIEKIKTKSVVAMLGALEVENGALLITADADSVLVRSANNIPGVSVAHVNTINVYSILKHDKLILTQDAAAKMEEVYK